MRKRKLRVNCDSVIVFMVILLGIITVLLPLRNSELPGNYYPDLGYHLIRIEGVKEAILAGEFPARIYNFALNGWGYGGSMFYQDYLLYIPALFRVLGIDIITSYKLMIVIYTSVIACTTYFSVKYISKSKYASSLITIALLLSQYYLADIYNRAGVSEYLALIFVPVLIAGIYDTFAEECKHPELIGVGLFGLLLTHSITFALGVVLLVICFLFNIRSFIRKPYQVVRLAKVALVTIMASAFIYVPLLEQMFSGEFRFHHPWAHVEELTQPVGTWFRLTGYFNTIAYIGIGVPVLFCILLRVCKRKLNNKWIDKILLFGIILILVTSKYFPWSIIGKTPLGFIQFTYRLYTFAIPIVTIGCGMLYAELFEEKRIAGKAAYLFLGGMIAFCGFLQLDVTSYSQESALIEEDYFEDSENTFYIGAEEWLPAGIKGKNIKKLERSVIADNDIRVDFNDEYNRISFNTIGGVQKYQIPMIYYKGYEATVTDKEGTVYKLPLIVDENNTGLMWVDNSAGYMGVVTVRYEGTYLQKLSLWVSLVTLFAVFGRDILKVCRRERE